MADSTHLHHQQFVGQIIIATFAIEHNLINGYGKLNAC